MLNTMIHSPLYEGFKRSPEALWEHLGRDEDTVYDMYDELLDAEEQNYGETRSRVYERPARNEEV